MKNYLSPLKNQAHRLTFFGLSISASLFGLLLATMPAYGAGNTLEDLNKIKNIVVIYAENRSFDNLYGLFPKANGILNNADGTATNLENFKQLDRDGVSVLPTLPSVWNALNTPAQETLAFVSHLPNSPFRIEAAPGGLSGGIAAHKATPDLVHRFYNHQMQINGGKNNMFAAWSDAGGLTMGYYDGASMQMWKLAQQYTLADNFFMGSFGGSFLNHFWLVCACTPRYFNAPENLTSQLEPQTNRLAINSESPNSALLGKPIYVRDQSVTTDGYAINTLQPSYQPSGIAPAQNGNQQLADATKNPLPPQDSSQLKTIGDTLSDKAINWAWYAGSFNTALNDRNIIYNANGANFQAHHQPFNYFSRFNPSTSQGAIERKQHFKDLSDFEADIAQGILPAVSFYKPQGNLNQHPGYTDVLSGDAHIAALIAQLQQSPQWKSMAVIVTYDENGGFWDHVTPPTGDRWGPGSRVPTIIISPFAKKNYVDHTIYDTTSIIKFITKRFKLAPLSGVREQAGDLSNAFEFAH